MEKHINLDNLGENDDEGYYDEDERIAQKMMPTKVEYDEEALSAWLTSIMPRVSQILDMNWKAKTFDNYEVFWEEERADIDLWHKLSTTFDFKEANKATQKAVNQSKSENSMSTTARDEEDDWGGPASTPSSDASKSRGAAKKVDDHF